MKFWAVLVCFVLSGFAALVYETAWMRQFSVVFGTSELAVATVLASYMAGLAVGSALAARFIDRIRRPLLTYGVLELGIAVSAMLVPLALKLALGIHASVNGGEPHPPDAAGVGQSLFYLALAFPILMVPTAFMGATLPLLARHVVREEDQIGRRTGLLYALNTAGAVAGTLAAAFFFLPAVGLWGTILVGVAVNVVVFFIAAALARATERPDQAPSRPALSAPPGGSHASWVLAIMLVSGLVSFTYEVLWTRLLGHLLGASIYAFSTMLASFLAGITLGSLVASYLAKRRESSALGLAAAQFGIALTSIFIYLSIDRIPGFAAALGTDSYLWRNVILSGIVLFPATLCIGATFPFAVRILAGDTSQAGAASARVYAFNTVGAIAGAILAGFVFLPTLEFSGTVRLGVTTNLVLGFSSLFLFGRAPWKALVPAGILAAVCLVLFQPSRPERLVRSSPFSGMQSEGTELYYDVGRSATVLLLEQDGAFVVRSNGLPEADIPLIGAAPGNWLTRWLAALPILARPGTRDMLIIGLGGGVTAESIPSTVESIDVIELEESIVEANRAIADRRASDPLSDPRLRMIINDARGALSLTDKRYDAIVSQPSHPWTPGASNLFTHEFIRMAKDHLKEDGVFLQWMNVNFVDQELFASLGATLMDVFAHTRVYRPRPTLLLFLGSEAPLDVEEDLARTGEPLRSSPEYFGQLGVYSPVDVLSTLVMQQAGLESVCRGAPLNTDNNNLLATQSPKILANPLGIQGANELLRFVDPLVPPTTPLYASVAPLGRAHVALKLCNEGRSDRALLLAGGAPDNKQRALATALVRRSMGDEAEAQRLLESARLEAPNDPHLRYALLRAYLPQLAAGGEVPDAILSLAEGLPPSAAAVVQGYRLQGAADWQGVRELDAALASSPPGELWFTDALELRASWRIFLETETSAALGLEALELCDRLWSLQSQPHLLLLRIQAALRADRPYAVLESARMWAKGMGKLLATGQPNVRLYAAPTANELVGVVSSLGMDPRVEKHRVQSVLAQLRNVAQ